MDETAAQRVTHSRSEVDGERTGTLGRAESCLRYLAELWQPTPSLVAFECIVECSGADEPGTHREQGDVVLGDFEGDALGEEGQAGLCRGVRRLIEGATCAE